MKLLIAGPGTGKTTRVKTVIDEDYPNARNVLVLSFTNATVDDLSKSFSSYKNVSCYTLHSYALMINHQKDLYILDGTKETAILDKLASDLDLDFSFLCSQLDCITFETMISSCLQFIKINKVYSEETIGELDLLIVDEYQDFNAVERELVSEISRYSKETLILGDDDQSIYGFKDADPDGIIKLYQSDSTEHLDHEHVCYRCPDVIVASAHNLIAHNTNRIDKPWNPCGKDGDLIPLQFRTQHEANRFVAEEIRRIQSENPEYTFLVLSPVRYYVEDLLDVLQEKGIDCVNFWETDLEADEYFRIWWLRAIFSRRRLLNLLLLSETLSRYFRRKLRDYLYTAFREGIEHSEIINEISEYYRNPLTGYFSEQPELADFQNDHPDYQALIESIDSEDSEYSLDNLIKKMNPRKKFDSNAVNIMSIHKSKGLQADIVLISGLVNGVLPNETRGLDTIEAQRRLLFVGITRALHRLYLISPMEWDGRYVHRVDKTQFSYNYRSKTYFAETSRFIGEL